MDGRICACKSQRPACVSATQLLPRGAQILDELFPGLLDDLVTGGVPVLRAPREFRFVLGGHLMCLDGEPGEPSYAQSRPYLKAGPQPVRLPNVSIQGQCEVAGLVTTSARDRVTGARVLPLAGAEQTLAADLVVDATGRTGRTPAWLTEIGYDPPAEEQLRLDIDRQPQLRLLRVTGLLDPPTRLLRPAVTLRVLTGNLRRRHAPPASAGHQITPPSRRQPDDVQVPAPARLARRRRSVTAGSD